jgi:O-antigen/teichoic acid export membrane protein
MGKTNTIVKNTALIFASRVITALLGFAATLMIARHFGVEDYGKFALALSFVALFIPLGDLGMDILLTREVAKAKESLKNILGNVLAIKLILAVVFLGLVVSVVNLMGYGGLTKSLVYVAAVSAILTFTANSFISSFRAFERMEYEAVSSVLAKLLTAVAVFALIFLNKNLLWMMWAQVMGGALLLLSSLFFLRSKFATPSLRMEFSLWKKLITGGLPFALTYFMVMVYFKIDSVMLSKMVGDEAVGAYNAAYNIVFALMIISSAIVGSIFPAITYNYFQDKEYSQKILTGGLKYSLILSFPFALGGTILAKKVIFLIYGQAYTSSILALQIIIWVVPVIFVTNLLGNCLGAINRQKEVLYVALANALLNVILNLILIPRFSFYGSAAATLVTELFGMVILLRLISQEFQLRLWKFLILVLGANLFSLPVFYIFNPFNVLVIICIFGGIYFLCLLALGLISLAELKSLLPTKPKDLRVS